MGIDKAVDGIARQEYDYIVRDLALALRDGTNLSEVKGLSYRDEAGVVLNNPNAEHITDLDEIPYAAKFIKEHLCVRDYVFPAAAFPSIRRRFMGTSTACARPKM